jgi:hypothetical protein
VNDFGAFSHFVTSSHRRDCTVIRRVSNNSKGAGRGDAFAFGLCECVCTFVRERACCRRTAHNIIKLFIPLSGSERTYPCEIAKSHVFIFPAPLIKSFPLFGPHLLLPCEAIFLFFGGGSFVCALFSLFSFDENNFLRREIYHLFRRVW